MMKFHLVINGGNTTTTFALLKGNGEVEEKISVSTRKIGKECNSLIERLGELLEKVEVEGPPFIASVIPRHDEDLTKITQALTGSPPLFIGAHLDTGLKIQYHTPHTLGADRIANAAFAHHLFPEDHVVVVDIGTAINLDCVTDQGVFLGGAIAPGPRLGVEALRLFTDKLPKVDLEQFSGQPLGRDTAACIRSGIVLGLSGLVDRLVSELESTLSKKGKVILTGGGAPLLKPYLKRVDLDEPDLTLKGIVFVGLRNAY